MQPGRAAFTRIELLVVAGILLLLIALLFPALQKSGARSVRIKCVSNIHNVGMSFRMFASSNGDRFPWETNTLSGFAPNAEAQLLGIILSLTNELSTPKIIVCPADSRDEPADWKTFSLENLSYFVGLTSETNPKSFLFGDRNLTTNGTTLRRGRADISAPTELGWDRKQHRFEGNVVMADGSVQQLNAARTRNHWKDSGQTNMTLLVP